MSATVASIIGALATLWAARCRIVPAWKARPEGVRMWQVTRWLRPQIDMGKVREDMGCRT